MGSVGFHVLSFGLPTLAYVRVHCEVEAIDVMRGAATAGRMRSARTAARGSMAGGCEGGRKLKIRKENRLYKLMGCDGREKRQNQAGRVSPSWDEIIDRALGLAQ